MQPLASMLTPNADTLASVNTAVVKMRSCALTVKCSLPPGLDEPLPVDPLRQVFA